jgi:elongation factor 1 alpha-like protein
MSKLQRLAAARKKKSEEKAEETIEQTRSQLTGLSVNESKPLQENRAARGPFGKRLKTSASTSEGVNPLASADPRSSGHERQTLGDITNEQQDLENTSPIHTSARPSAFAQTLFGSPEDEPKRNTIDAFPLPYDKASVLNAFSKPSPDDVVLTAQAKGSIMGKTDR